MPAIVMDELRMYIYIIYILFIYYIYMYTYSLKPKKKEQRSIDAVEAMLRETFNEWKSKMIESPTVKIG